MRMRRAGRSTPSDGRWTTPLHRRVLRRGARELARQNAPLDQSPVLSGDCHRFGHLVLQAHAATAQSGASPQADMVMRWRNEIRSFSGSAYRRTQGRKTRPGYPEHPAALPPEGRSRRRSRQPRNRLNERYRRHHRRPHPPPQPHPRTGPQCASWGGDAVVSLTRGEIQDSRFQIPD